MWVKILVPDGQGTSGIQYGSSQASNWVELWQAIPLEKCMTQISKEYKLIIVLYYKIWGVIFFLKTAIDICITQIEVKK